MLNLEVNKKYYTHVIAVGFLIIISCQNRTFDGEQELWRYLKDESNKYIQHKTVNGIDFSLLYKPTDILVQQELENSQNKQEIRKLREKYSQYMYLALSMSRNNQELLSTAPKNRNDFGAMVNQLAFGMSSKVHLYTQQKDTLELVDFVYPRMYGMTKTTDVLFVYPRNEKYLADKYIYFTIEDLGLNTGEVKFKIPIDKINHEPKINF